MSQGKPSNAATYRKATADLCARFKSATVAEVGVYAGDLSKLLAALPHVKQHVIVDSWVGGYAKFSKEHMDRIAQGVIDWGSTVPKVTVHRMDSKDGAALYPDEHFDFFHTDGDHSLEGIRGDIQAWLPKVKTGGILSGDNFEIPEVAQGVKELLPHYELLANGRLWWAIKK